jgi:cytochrome P450
MLSQLDLYEGKVDGFVGPRTEAAIKAFQYTESLKVDGWAGPRTLTQLQQVVQTKFQDDDMTAGPQELPVAIPEDYTAYNTDVHRYLRQLHDQQGDTFVLMRGGQPVVFVRSPEAVRTVLMSENFGKTWDSSKVSSSDADYVMNLVQPMVARTIFNMHGEANAHRRKLLRPTFLGLDHFMRGFGAATDALIAKWQDGILDIQDEMHALLRMNLLTVFFGEEHAYAHDQMAPFHETVDYFVKRYSEPCHSQAVIEQDEKMLNNIVQASQNMVDAFRQTPPGPAADRSIVHLMIQDGADDQEIAGTIVNVMIAAAEAPASALALILQELCRNTAVQDKLHQEVAQVMGSDGEPSEHMSELKYVEACVREGLRLFAPATLVQRQAMVDSQLDGYTVPKGQVVGVCIHAVHMDPIVWDKPEEFNPHRPGLLYEVIKKDRAYVTFSGGPRGCPGKHLAVGIMRIALAKLVQRFKFAPAPVINQPVPKFVEWQVHGIPVQITHR